ncbi:putative ahpC/TSA antioxidant enzyme [Lyophyllum shimeji]|uniref:AhpC/TSA antioxidant enzyme n=1 Tax=Lyophyllum shimeji TaxID=47721 RepID=A0A9P3PQL2_LYOSH|nr:putative ahpC/TSA antioxidant enzyme [Lyophyllum shimeji]
MSSATLPSRQRIKRKPPPPVDVRYPAPDPDDPFAPLSVLRSRSSHGALALAPPPKTNASLPSLYPEYLHHPPALLRESHYRRRSQSTPPTQAHAQLIFPPIQSAVPSLLTDDSSGTDADPVPAAANAKHVPDVLPSWPSSPIKLNLARLLLPKKNRTSLSMKGKQHAPIRVLSISSPLQSHTPPRTPRRQHTTSSSASSFVHISNPSVSTLESAHPYTSPRPAPVPASPNPARNPLRNSSSAPLPSRSPPAHSHTTPTPPESEWSLPTPPQLARAASLPVIAASGLRVPFASLFAARRTVVVFVRHFWCPLCQDYIASVVDAARPELMFAANEREGRAGRERVDLVVISNGAPAFIPKYRQLFGLPFELYTDPTLAVYTALGMGRFVPSSSPSCGEGASERERACVRDGGYVRHGAVAGIALVVMRALKAGMPVWEKGGDIHQLGGEFVLGPGLKCSYAHRMQSPRGHAPIRDVLAAAGVSLPPPTPAHSPPRPPAPPPTPATRRVHRRNSTTAQHTHTHTHVNEFGVGAWRRCSIAIARTEGPTPPARRASMAVLSLEDEDAWMQERIRSLERLRERKSERRGAFVGYRAGPEAAGRGLGGSDGGVAGEDQTRRPEEEEEEEEEGGRQREAGHCSPPGEEDATAPHPIDPASAVDLAEVMVIGFAGARAGEAEAEDSVKGGVDMDVSPTGATKDSGERDAA